MKNILIVSIAKGTAVDRLSIMTKRYNPHLNIEVLPFHPKRYSQEDLKVFEEKVKKADLIDFQYWKNAVVLLEKFPWLSSKIKILTHHNPYDLHERPWTDFQQVVVKNRTQQKELPGSLYIPHAVDVEYFTYNEDYNAESKVVGMVAFRMEGHKGILEVAKACKELGYRFLLVGHISKPAYYKEILETGAEIDFVEDANDEQLRQAYYEMGCLICNSVDNFETGTLPILEAMSCGVPVISRNTGLVPDIYNLEKENLIVRNGQVTDVEDLKNELKSLMENKEKRIDLRKNGWDTVKGYSDIKMAKMYANLYNKLLFDNPLASIILPVYNRKEQIKEIALSLEEQTYKNIELVIIDDHSNDGLDEIVKEIKQKVIYPIKFIKTGRGEGYNLATARNLGIIEAEGEVIVFCDSRLKPSQDAIGLFIKEVLSGKGKFWAYGNKGNEKSSFVENFSAVKREDIIKGGMFCERIDKYGGMTQEVFTRFKSQGFTFKYFPEITAEQILSSRSKGKRADIWKMKYKLWTMYGN